MSILIKPIITEKATLGSETLNTYTFLVNTKANGVTVEKVRTQNYHAERKMRYTKSGIQKGKTNTTKKAIVHVVEGETIDFYSNI